MGWVEFVMKMSSRRRSRAGVSANIADANLRRPTRIVLALLGLLTFCAAGRAADCLGVLVRDPSGSAVPGARITANGEERLTDDQGAAEICAVAGDQRTIRVRSQGFKPVERRLDASLVSVVIDLELRTRVETPIVVTGTPEPRELAEINRSLTVLAVEETDVPAWSFADVLKQDTSIDLRERGPDGTQADLSIRGSSFDQVLVLVNGIRVNDSQTGHHNMDLPMPLESVQQVEVLHGTGSTLYGSDAIGGAVNFVTKKPQGAELKLMGGGGDFGWHRQSVIGGFKLGDWSQQTSFSRDFSSGFAPGRDFRNVAFSSESFLDKDFGSTTVMFAKNDRPFGANGFYGPWDSWEDTGSTFLAASQTIGRSEDRLQHRFNFGYRRHTDHFVLFRHRPEIFENFHTTNHYQGGYSVNSRWSDKVSWSAGASLLSEGIDSSNLGLRRRERASAFFTVTLHPTERLNLTIGAREEVWRKWKGETSPTFSIGYWLGRGFKLRGQAGHAYRIPTYTDLYYEDPVSKGNSNLLPENVWNYEAGADWYSDQGTTVSLTWFERQEDNTIDWVREPGLQKFNARNFAELTFRGGEVQVRQRVGSSEIGVNYTAIRASKVPTPGVTSRYVFNFPLNSLSVSYHGSLSKYLAVKLRLGAFNRTWQSTKALWDTSLIYTAGRWRPFFQVSNLLNQSHEAFQGLAQPGRWIRGGVQVQVF